MGGRLLDSFPCAAGPGGVPVQVLQITETYYYGQVTATGEALQAARRQLYK